MQELVQCNRTGSLQYVIEHLLHLKSMMLTPRLQNVAHQSFNRPSVSGILPTFAGLSEDGLGLLRKISLAQRAEAKRRGQLGPLSFVYDNVNLSNQIEAQTLGHKDNMMNGTCASVYPLFEANVEDMKTADYLAKLDAAPPLTIQDIMLTTAENDLLHRCLKHNILRIILAFGGPGFARFRDKISATEPLTEDRIPVHKTEVYGLPAMPVDESTITGNAEVIDRMWKELQYDSNNPRLISTNIVKLLFGDQMSISRARTVAQNRTGHNSARRSYLDLIFAPGLFHGQMHAVFGCLDTHWGNPKLGPRDPGSLAFHNVVLDRKPVVLSSLPPYRVCRDLLFVSLYARVLHCLELVSGKSLQEYTKSVTFEDLERDAGLIYERYASSAIVDRLRQARHVHLRTHDQQADTEPPIVGDMVFENAVLFMRDTLIVREFCDAIKVGDSGRIVLLLKIFAFMYRGTGRTKYAYEMLHLVHNLTHVWPAPLR